MQRMFNETYLNGSLLFLVYRKMFYLWITWIRKRVRSFTLFAYQYFECQPRPHISCLLLYPHGTQPKINQSNDAMTFKPKINQSILHVYSSGWDYWHMLCFAVAIFAWADGSNHIALDLDNDMSYTWPKIIQTKVELPIQILFVLICQIAIC